MRRILVAAACAWTVLHSDFAHAQADSERVVARDLFRGGTDLQRAGGYADALARFEKAQKLVSAPTNLVHIAQCDVAIGHLVEAQEAYRAATRLLLPSDASPVLIRAQRQAKAELSALEPRVPRVTLAITPPDARDLQITMDDHSLNAAVAGEPLPLDPGTHRFVISAAGYSTASGVVRLAEGEAKRISVALRSLTGAQGAGESRPEVTEETSSTSSSIGPPTTAYIALGVGAAGLLVGTAFAILAVSAKSDAGCPNPNACPATFDVAAHNATVSRDSIVAGLGFGVAALSGAGGTWLLLSDNGQAKPEPTNTTGVRVAPRIDLPRPWWTPTIAR